MKKTFVLTSFVALAIATHATNAMADYTENSQYGETCSVGNIGAYDSSTSIATAHFALNTHNCDSGYYLPADVDSCTQCPAGSFCDSADTYTFDSANDQGIETCPTGYTNSDSGATASTQCYRACATSDILHSKAVTGNMYYDGTSGNGVNTCVPTSCDSGYHVDSASCTANTITVRWGDKDGGVHESNTCTYGGTLYTPTTAPTAPKGHHFTGWTFPAPTYDFSTLDANKNGNSHTLNARNRTWTATFDYGTVSGVSLCSVTPGTEFVAGTPDESTTGDGAVNCWCKATGYTPAGSNVVYENSSSSAWVFVLTLMSADLCAWGCSPYCGLYVQDKADFRRALFGIQQ